MDYNQKQSKKKDATAKEYLKIYDFDEDSGNITCTVWSWYNQ